MIPLSILFGFMGMAIFGVSANLMSLGAIDFGMIVDGSVVMIENSVHHLPRRDWPAILNDRIGPEADVRPGWPGMTNIKDETFPRTVQAALLGHRKVGGC
jgi:hypothetical protein